MTRAVGEGITRRAGPSRRSAALESVLVSLRQRVEAVRFVLETPDAEQARLTRRELLDRLESYLLPRVRRHDAPILVVVAGSTGAGKSTLVNSLVRARVSATGVRRPTTNSPVLACHPADIDWFAEDKFLPTLPRVRQEGLARPGRDGLLVLASNERVPQGVAILDSPDIDSVVEAHHEFARRFLDAADLWLFATTAARYADAPVWEWLRRALERDTVLAVVLSRIPGTGRGDVEDHFSKMLDENGLRDVERFFIPETVITDGALPDGVIAPIRAWIEDLAGDADRRAAVVTRTLGGALRAFRTRIPELARQVEQQVELRAELRSLVEGAYAAALAEIEEDTRNGSLLRGEVLARWQEFAATGDLLRSLQSRRGSPQTHRRGHKWRSYGRMRALERALRTSLESLVVAGAHRAAEAAVARWQDHPAGRELLGGRAEDLMQASPEFARRVGRAISSWHDHVVTLIESEGVTKRSIARVASIDGESLALVLMIGLLGFGTSDVPTVGGTSAAAQRILKSVFGAESLRSIGDKARTDLRARIGMLFGEEAIRFGQVLDAAGVPDDSAAAELFQATYDLEVLE